MWKENFAARCAKVRGPPTPSNVEAQEVEGSTASVLHLPLASALVTILGPLQGIPLRLVCSTLVKGSAL